MVKNDLGYKRQNMGGEKVLFHKVIFHSYEEAINILKSRNLAPGELAVARYYVGYDDTTIPPSWDYIRMVLAIGGATPNSNDDTYFFKDFTDNGDESITFDDLEEKLSNYYTKEEIETILGDDAWRDLVNQRLNNIDNDIDEIRKNIGNGGGTTPDFELDDYYTKTEVDDIISKLNIPDSNEYVTKEEFNSQVQLISEKANISDVYTKTQVDDIISKLNIPDFNEYVTKEEFNSQTQLISEKANISDVYTKDEVDNNFTKKEEVEEFVRIKVSELIETDEEVNNTIETKLDEVISNKDLVTTENVGDVVKEYIDSSLFDGGEEEEEWV